MPAMRAGDVVLRPQMRAHADGCGLLARVKMHKTGYAALREFFLDALLKAANRHHVAIRLEQFLAAELHGVLPVYGAGRNTACFAAASQSWLGSTSGSRDLAQGDRPESPDIDPDIELPCLRLHPAVAVAV